MTVVNAVEQIRSSKGGRPTREAAAELGERILDIALEHFLRYGFEGASMDAIAADAQVSKRTLYQRHQSKKGLLLSVRERERHVYRAIVNIPLPRGSVRQQIGMLAHNILDAILNARAWQQIEAGAGFSDFIWSAVDGSPVQHGFTDLSQVPATTPAGDALAKRLKQAGFRFCGPTIVYAFAQAVGLFNDHVVSCPAHDRCAALA